MDLSLDLQYVLIGCIAPALRGCGRADNHSPESTRDGFGVWEGQGRRIVSWYLGLNQIYGKQISMQKNIVNFYPSAFGGSQEIHIRCFVLESGSLCLVQRTMCDIDADILIIILVASLWTHLYFEVMMASKLAAMDTVLQLLAAGLIRLRWQVCIVEIVGELERYQRWILFFVTRYADQRTVFETFGRRILDSDAASGLRYDIVTRCDHRYEFSDLRPGKAIIVAFLRMASTSEIDSWKVSWKVSPACLCVFRSLIKQQLRWGQTGAGKSYSMVGYGANKD